MSQLNPVLYGDRLYGKVTYSANADTETLMLMLNESMSMSDADVINTTKVLSDLATMMDSISASVNKPLSETVAMTETFVTTATKVLADSASMTDDKTLSVTKPLAEAVALSESFLSNVTKPLADTVTMTEDFMLVLAHMLADFVTAMDAIAITMFVDLHEELLLQDWLSIRIQKPQQWTVAIPTQAPYNTLYGQVLFGQKIYSGLSGIMWVANTPTVPSTLPSKGWRSYNQLNDQP